MKREWQLFMALQLPKISTFWGGFWGGGMLLLRHVGMPTSSSRIRVTVTFLRITS